MSRFFVLGCSVLTLFCCLAQDPQLPAVKKLPSTHKGPLTEKRVLDPSVRSNLLAKTGGIVLSPASGPALVFENAQTRVPSTDIHALGDQLSKFLRLPIEVRDQVSTAPVNVALSDLTDTNIAAVIVIGDSAGYPSILLAPEARWAVINVDALSEKDISEGQLADRVQKEMLRTFGMLLGAAYSTQETCVLKPVLKPADLDTLKAKGLSLEALNKVLTYGVHLGMHQRRPTTYRKAVEEGWAPAPTNTFQQAIWDELKK